MLLDVVIPVVAGLLLLWIAGIGLLWWLALDEMTIRDAVRFAPELVGLVRRLAADHSMPRSVRVRLWLLLGYLVSPIDLVPDVIPVLGQADDVIVVGLVLRSVVRRAGPKAVERHWRGSEAGLQVVRRLAGL